MRTDGFRGTRGPGGGSVGRPARHPASRMPNQIGTVAGLTTKAKPALMPCSLRPSSTEPFPTRPSQSVTNARASAIATSTSSPAMGPAPAFSRELPIRLHSLTYAYHRTTTAPRAPPCSPGAVCARAAPISADRGARQQSPAPGATEADDVDANRRPEAVAVGRALDVGIAAPGATPSHAEGSGGQVGTVRTTCLGRRVVVARVPVLLATPRSAVPCMSVRES